MPAMNSYDFTTGAFPQFGGSQPKSPTFVSDPTVNTLPPSTQIPTALQFPQFKAPSPAQPQPSAPQPAAAVPPPNIRPSFVIPPAFAQYSPFQPAALTIPSRSSIPTINPLPAFPSSSFVPGTPGAPGISGVPGTSGTPTAAAAPPNSYPQNLAAALYGSFGGPGNIFETVNAAPQSQQMQNYVNQASQGLKGAYEQDLANQLIQLQSRYAGEGSYLSSPMFAAEGQLRANLGANYLNELGQLQLGAAESERGRQYGAATQQGNNALSLAQMFQGLAQQAQASGASVLAAQYSAMASMFGSQAGAQASIFGSQAGMFNNQNSKIGRAHV